MRLSTKVAYNTIIQIIGKAVSTILGLAAVALMARYLGTEGFGQYTTIFTFLSFFGILADFGLTLVTVQMISAANIDEEKILGNLFGLRLVSALFFLSLAPLTAAFFPYSPLIKIGIILAIPSFFFPALNQILTGLFQKKLRLDKAAIAENIGRAALLAGVIAAMHYNLGLLGIIAAAILSSAVNFLFHFIFSREFARFRPRFDLALWKKIINKSWPIAATIFFNLIYLKTDTIILSVIKSQTDVGIYGAAYKVIDVLITLPFIFAGIILPILASARSKGETNDYKRIMQKSFDFMAIIAAPLIIGAQLTSKKIMVLVAGAEFAAAGDVLKILIFAAGAIFLGCIFSHAIIALDKQKKMIGAYIFTALTSVAGYLIFIPKYGYFGAAYVTIYSELLIALISLYLVWKYSGFKPNLKILLKSSVAALMMVLPTYFLQNQSLLIILCAAAACYFIFLYMLGGITKKDLEYLIN